MSRMIQPPGKSCIHFLSNPLCTETVQGASRSFERIDNIQGGHSLSLGVFCVCYRITNNLRVTELERE